MPAAPATGLLSNSQVAARLGIAPKTWANWKSAGRFDDLPQPVAWFGAVPRYSPADVDAFIARHSKAPASQPA